MMDAMSRRAVQDRHSRGRSELERAQRRSRRSASRCRYRESQSNFSTRRTADGINKLAAELRVERARVEEDASAAKRSNIEESVP